MEGIASLIIIVALSCVLYFIIVYQRLARMIEIIKGNRRYLYTVIEWRFQLMETFEEVIKEQIDIKDTVLSQFDDLSTKSQQAKKQKKFQEFMRSENAISQMIAGVELMFEQHPQLQNSAQALEIKEEVHGIQTELESAIQIYNNDIEVYNKTKSYFLYSMVMSVFASKVKFNFPFWKMDGRMKPLAAQEQEKK
jgi:LemA protein